MYACSMVPANLHDFMIACLGASASFIGLLFVSLSVVLQRVGDEKLADKDRSLAESSFAGLINIFFIALVAILPHENIGYVCLTVALLGFVNCLRIKHISNWPSLALSIIIYGTELIFALNLITHKGQTLNVGVFQTIIIALFAISLLRAWGLTGIRTKH